MNYTITAADTINNVTGVLNVNNIDNTNNLDNISTIYEDIESFQDALTPLKQYGWRFVKSDPNTIIMNKQFYELDEIAIEYKYNHYHFNLPINNSIYSYYRKFSDFYDALNYIELYINELY
jgi:hypothetical protein